jgi:hypothetical protein
MLFFFLIENSLANVEFPGVAKNNGQMTTTLTATNASTPTAGGASNPPQRGQSIRSIRSIITLPSYSRLPKDEEQVIAREGERSGMDLVVEFPETAEDQENRREEEMSSLYDIRVRRREELAERDERRRQRQEARAAGDTDRLMQLSRASMASRQNRDRPSASTMLAEHQSRDRHQRFASVSYADIGHVRHDGSRIRANSNDSDHRPLLEENVRQSTQSILTVQSQARSSVSGISSISTSIHSGDDNQPDEADEGDLSAAHIPPPSYDYDDWGEAPAYESPIAGTREQAGLLLTDVLPQIRIDTVSPSTSTLVASVAPVSPVSPVSPITETNASSTTTTTTTTTTTSGSHEPTSNRPENPHPANEATETNSS